MCVYQLNIFTDRSGFTVNSDYVKVPIFPILLIISPNVPEFLLLYFPILCKLDNLTLLNDNFLGSVSDMFVSELKKTCLRIQVRKVPPPPVFSALHQHTTPM